MSGIPVPPGWNDDPLSQVLQAAIVNGHHVFHFFPRVFGIWERIHGLYERVSADLGSATPWFPTLFVPRTHSSWLAGVRLAASGQLSEAYMVLRGCLEYGLYAFFIHEDPHLPGTPERAETYLRRHDGAQWMKKVKQEFRPSAMLDLLEGKDTRIGQAARCMYEMAIDNGAHPNAQGLLTNMNMTNQAGGFLVTSEYLNADPLARGLCWKTTADVGATGLYIFSLMWRGLFDQLGIMPQLDELANEIDRDPQTWKAPACGQ